MVGFIQSGPLLEALKDNASQTGNDQLVEADGQQLPANRSEKEGVLRIPGSRD